MVLPDHKKEYSLLLDQVVLQNLLNYQKVDLKTAKLMKELFLEVIIAPDFEKVLRETNTELFTIEQQFPLNSLDYLGISIGYELLATNILQVLELGGLSLRTKDRKETDPVVFAGGPAITNPAPFGPFFDFVYIGEAENIQERLAIHINDYNSGKESYYWATAVCFVSKDLNKALIRYVFPVPKFPCKYNPFCFSP